MNGQTPDGNRNIDPPASRNTWKSGVPTAVKRLVEVLDAPSGTRQRVEMSHSTPGV